MGESCLVQQLRYEHKIMAGGQPQAELRARDNCVCYTFWQRTPRRDAKEATSLHLHPTILCVRYDFCNKKKCPHRGQSAILGHRIGQANGLDHANIRKFVKKKLSNFR